MLYKILPYDIRLYILMFIHIRCEHCDKIVLLFNEYVCYNCRLIWKLTIDIENLLIVQPYEYVEYSYPIYRLWGNNRINKFIFKDIKLYRHYGISDNIIKKISKGKLLTLSDLHNDITVLSTNLKKIMEKKYNKWDINKCIIQYILNTYTTRLIKAANDIDFILLCVDYIKLLNNDNIDQYHNS